MEDVIFTKETPLPKMKRVKGQREVKLSEAASLAPIQEREVDVQPDFDTMTPVQLAEFICKYSYVSDLIKSSLIGEEMRFLAKDRVCAEIAVRSKSELQAYAKSLGVVRIDATPTSRNAQRALDILEKQYVSDTSFGGRLLEEMAGVLYFLKTHKNTCAPIGGLLEWYCEQRPDGTCKGRLWTPPMFEELFQQCMRNDSVRFIFGLLSMSLKDASHANAWIYDKHDNSVEWFEPHGSRATDASSILSGVSAMYDHLRRYFHDTFGIEHFYTPNEFCPHIGIQSLQAREADVRLFDPGGFCAACGRKRKHSQFRYVQSLPVTRSSSTASSWLHLYNLSDAGCRHLGKVPSSICRRLLLTGILSTREDSSLTRRSSRVATGRSIP